MTDLRDQVVARVRGDQMVTLMRQLGFDPKRVGADYKILCPFHDDRRPSMAVNTAKSDTGIFKCFSCGWGGDVFEFVGQLRGLQSFPDRLNWLAQQVGVSTGRVVKEGKAPAKRERLERAAPTVETMQPAEVLAAYRELREAALDPAEWCARLGIDPWALDLLGGFVAPIRDRVVLVVPMRLPPDGTLSSLRFRCFESKRRWALDVKQRINGKMVQVKTSRAGLMATQDVFDTSICLDGLITVIIEGETDLLAALTMMRRSCGDDVAAWPARWVALPGVNSCHDMLFELRLTNTVLCFFDGDTAARQALFSQRPMRRNEETGAMEPSLDQPYQPRLLARFRATGIGARAAFPPLEQDDKVDLRDMVRGGMDWNEFFNWCLLHGTADTYGRTV